jgi:hypothetical protein
MNVQLGARRIKIVGIWTTLLLCIPGVFLLIVCLTVNLMGRAPGSADIGLLDLLLMPLLLALPGASLWLIGWIIEGFADRDQPNSFIQHPERNSADLPN